MKSIVVPVVVVGQQYIDVNMIDQEEIINAYITIRKENNTIPDEVLDFMKNSAINALNPKDEYNDEEPKHEYEMHFDSDRDNSPISIYDWYPIATHRIKEPEKIPEYIEKGLLRKIKNER